MTGIAVSVWTLMEWFGFILSRDSSLWRSTTRRSSTPESSRRPRTTSKLRASPSRKRLSCLM